MEHLARLVLRVPEALKVLRAATVQTARTEPTARMVQQALVDKLVLPEHKALAVKLVRTVPMEHRALKACEDSQEPSGYQA